jgi:putative MFS transporter
MSRLGSAIGTGLLPLAILHYGMPATTGMLAVVLIVGAIVSIAWAPETKGLSLVDAAQDSAQRSSNAAPAPAK